MADKIVFRYEDMQRTVDSIRDIADHYARHGETFIQDFTNATQEWEGESKDQMLKLIDGDVNKMITKDVPDFLRALATLLEENLKQIRSADEQIASSIPPTLS